KGVRMRFQSSAVNRVAAQNAANTAAARSNGKDAISDRDPPPTRNVKIRKSIGADAARPVPKDGFEIGAAAACLFMIVFSCLQYCGHGGRCAGLMRSILK